MTNVRDFGAVGDGKTDDTEAIQHAIDEGVGRVELTRGDYLITRTLQVDLSRVGRTGIDGSLGTAKLLMAGSGPAIHLKGTHASTADPAGFRPAEWQNERMPIVRDIEIEGRHAKAGGIRIVGVMQPTLSGVLIREVHTAVHVTSRARNLLIDGCHFYHNTGVGVHLDSVDLHQTIIADSHISYCRLGGIRIENSEIRNLQITGNDIEYNNNASHGVEGADDEPTAEIYIDVAAGSVREGTIVSNTIQATASANGANIRMIGSPGEDRETVNHKAGMWTISGNLIGSQRTNIHLTSVRGVVISGNHIYSGHHRNLLIESSRNIVVGPNCFGHNPDYRK
ncbi:MAG: right-handed parallel beta-helix repeat-containing protein, partial [Planctomycetaceae bacterium]